MLSLALRKLRDRSAFSLVELAIVVGISSIVALGTGSLIMQSVKVKTDATTRVDANNQAQWFRDQLKGTKFSEQSSGIETGFAAGACNGGILGFSTDASAAATVATVASIEAAVLPTPTGSVPLCVQMPDGTVLDIASRVGGETQLSKIKGLNFTNVAVVATDTVNNTKTYAGDLFMAYQSDPALVLSQVPKQNVFVTRMIIQVDNSGASSPPKIQKANLVSPPVSGTGQCSDSTSMGFDPSTGRCIHNTVNSLSGAVNLCSAGTLSVHYDGTQDASCMPAQKAYCNDGRAAIAMESLNPICSTGKPYTNSGGPPPVNGGGCSVPANYLWVDPITTLPCTSDTAVQILNGGAGVAVDSANPASPNRGQITLTCTAGVVSGTGVCQKGPTQVGYTGSCTVPAGTTWTDPTTSATCTSDAQVVIQSSHIGTLGDATTGVNRGSAAYACVTGTATPVPGGLICLPPNLQAPPGLTVTDPSCQAYALAYTACVNMAASTGFVCGMTPLAVGQICGTVVVEPIPAPVVNLPPQPKLGAPTTMCHCGGVMINQLQYCGFCGYTNDIGYGGGTNSTTAYTRVEQCQDGGLAYLSTYKLNVPADPNACLSGQRQVLSCDPTTLMCSIGY